MIKLTGFEQHGDYLKIDDMYRVYLKCGYSDIFEVNGLRVRTGTIQVDVTSPPVVKKVIKGVVRTTHYEDGDKNTMTVEEYNSIVNMYKNEDYEYEYPSLDAEFEHRKAMEALEAYRPVQFTPEDTYEDVPTRCIGEVVDTGSVYIENALTYNAAQFSNGNLYKVDLSAITANELNLFVDEHDLRDKYNNSTHSNVHYAKIDGDYVMTNIPYTRENESATYKTLKEAKEKEASVRKQVRSHLVSKVLGKDYMLKGKSLSSTYTIVESWISDLDGLDVKQKAYQSQRSLVNRMRKFKEELAGLIEQQNTGE